LFTQNFLDFSALILYNDFLGKCYFWKVMIMKIRIIAGVVVLSLLMAASGFADTLDEYDPNRTEQHTILMSASPYVTKTPSGNSALALPGTPADIEDFVIGTTPGNTNPSYPLSPPHNIYAYMITDPCTSGPKKKAMIDTGNHNTETSGSWAFQGMVDFFVSADPEADWLRKHVEFYIYPLVNPDGRYTATGRGNPEMTAEGFGTDHNRVWHTQGQGLSTIDALTTAMIADTGGDVHFAFDYHGAGSTFFYLIPSLLDCPYVEAFGERESSIPPTLRPGDYRMTRLWVMRPEGLNAEFSFVPENDKTGTVAQRLDLGKEYGLSIYDVMDPNSDYLKLKKESENWLVNNLEVQVQTGELVGFWNFDDGTADDSSGNGHHGTLVQSGGGTSVNIVYDGDRDSNVLELNNPVGHTINSVVDCGGAGSWADIRSRISIALWVKVDTFHASNQYLLTKGNTYQLTRSGTTNAMRSYMDGLSDTALSSSATVNDGGWHQVAVTYDSNSSERIIYIDGEDSGSDAPSGLLNVHTGTFVIGGRLNSSYDHRGWDGRVDDVRLYDYVLTPDDVDLLYQGSEPCGPQPLIICTENPDGDWNDDCKVNFLDFQFLASDWLEWPIYGEGVGVSEYYSNNVSSYVAIDATWSHKINGGDNRILVVAIAAEDDSESDLAIASVKYNNVEMNIVPGSGVTVGTGTKVKTVLYYLLEEDLPEPGYYNVAVTYAANDVAQRLGGSVSRANVAQQAPEAVATNSNTGQDTISTNITTVTADAWVVDVVACDDEGSFSTTTGGMTEQWDVNGDDAGSTAAGATKLPASAGLTTMSWSYSSGANMLAHSIAAFETLD